MTTEEIAKELEGHNTKLNELLKRQNRLKQIIRPHSLELELIQTDINYESGVIDALEAVNKPLEKVTEG